MKCRDITRLIEQQFPLHYAAGWDNVGLLAGSADQEVKKVYLALDADDEAVAEAVRQGADMLITHHPLLFSAVKKITDGDIIGRRLCTLIRHEIAYYAMHTNYDVLRMAALAAQIAGLQDCRVLEETWRETLYKLAVYVPVTHEAKVRQALTESGAGHIGNYKDCTFRSKGTGTFLPEADTSPFIGSAGKLEEVAEVKIETVVPRSRLSQVLAGMLAAHPYEEAAYDLYELKLDGPVEGFGRVGRLPQEMSLQQLGEEIKKRFGLAHLQVFGDLKKTVNRAAISPGSGKSMIAPAISSGADVLITGDIGHHEGTDAVAEGLAVIDAGHYGLEHIFIDDIGVFLEKRCGGLAVVRAGIKSPFEII